MKPVEQAHALQNKKRKLDAVAASSDEAKVSQLLSRYGTSFCGDLGIEISSNTPDALFQWLIASLLASARVKPECATGAMRALLGAGLRSPAALADAGRQTEVTELLQQSGAWKSDGRLPGTLRAAAQQVLSEYGGDLNMLRLAAEADPHQVRAALKRLRGVGDGSVDVFFREVQLAWRELVPFADKLALKAARGIGLRATSAAALLPLAGHDPHTFVRLTAALVRVETARAHQHIIEGAATSSTSPVAAETRSAHRPPYERGAPSTSSPAGVQTCHGPQHLIETAVRRVGEASGGGAGASEGGGVAWGAGGAETGEGGAGGGGASAAAGGEASAAAPSRPVSASHTPAAHGSGNGGPFSGDGEAREPA